MKASGMASCQRSSLILALLLSGRLVLSVETILSGMTFNVLTSVTFVQSLYADANYTLPVICSSGLEVVEFAELISCWKI